MKKLLTPLALAALTVTAQAQTPAFPGAEGHGRYTTGGRGGKIIHVTNLNDSGTGSFRQAVKGNEKKTVVFDVAGVIPLSSNVSIGANTTILGQTAPKPGITLRYYTVSPAGDNIIMRFIRIRRGSEKDVNDGADASTARHYTKLLLDHCSFSWSIDEVASFYDNNNFTMQWCTIGESLNNAGHGKGAHGYGGIWGGKLASFHHNLILHVNNRSPRFNGARYNWDGYTSNALYTKYKWENAVQAENVDFRNCVVYNADGCYGGPGGGQINMVGNYYKSGPAAKISKLTQVTVGAEGNAEGYPIYWDMTSRYYVSGNLIDDQDAGWDRFVYDSGTVTRGGVRYSKDPNHYNGADAPYITVSGTDYVCMQLDEPAPTGEVTTHDATTAYEKVCLYAGASLHRDNVDDRYMTETMTGTATYSGSITGKPGRIDLVSDVDGYTEKNFGTGAHDKTFDADQDGMDDEWEVANGLDTEKNDANLYTLDPVHYYTNIEVYANSLVQRIMLDENSGASDAVQDYYPAYYTKWESLVKAINVPEIPDEQEVTITLAQSTNMGGNTTSTYQFDGDVTITNTRAKGYAAGNNDGIKYSAGVQYTIHLPQDITVSSITFTGYDNYTDANAYLAEVAGTTYAATDYVFPKTKDIVSHTIDLPDATGSITFTPQGKQTVLVITLSGRKKKPTIVTDLDALTSSSLPVYYNLQGMRIAKPAHGMAIEVCTRSDGSRQSRKVVFGK